MKVKSLKRKLFSNYVISIFIGFFLFSSALFWFLTLGLYKKMDSVLISEMGWVKNFMKSNMQYGEEYVVEEIAEHLDPKGDDEFAIMFSQDRKIVYLSQNLKKNNFLFPSFPKMPDTNYFLKNHSVEFDKNDSHYRVITERIALPGGKEYILEIAFSLSDVKAIQKQLLIWVFIIMPLIGIPFALWANFSAVKISKPLEIISDIAKKITVKELSQEIEIPSSYKEVQDLADSFNKMICKLDRSISEIKRFTSDASHELRTPLSVLKSQIQVALKDKVMSLQFRKIFKSELDEVNYMEKIVNNLLTLSRYDSGKMKLEKSPVDLSDLLIEQCEKIKKFARSKNVRIDLNTVHPVMISGDKTYLIQMISNLLENAIKYNKEQGKVHVDLRVLKNKGSCMLTVRDTGAGISKADLPHIFDRFYRADKSRSREIAGSGLGLSIVKFIVELHGGEVTIESQENKGTTALVILPLSFQVT